MPIDVTHLESRCPVDCDLVIRPHIARYLLKIHLRIFFGFPKFFYVFVSRLAMLSKNRQANCKFGRFLPHLPIGVCLIRELQVHLWQVHTSPVCNEKDCMFAGLKMSLPAFATPGGLVQQVHSSHL